MNEETAELHILASAVLCSGLFHSNGAYRVALFHTRRAVDLEPENIDYKEELLFFLWYT